MSKYLERNFDGNVVWVREDAIEDYVREVMNSIFERPIQNYRAAVIPIPNQSGLNFYDEVIIKIVIGDNHYRIVLCEDALKYDSEIENEISRTLKPFEARSE